jgi:hypothetical protein
VNKYMKKFLLSIAALGLVAMVFMPTYAAKPDNTPNNGNSHNKATGNIEAVMGSTHLYADFNAHETDPAKGEYHVWGNVGVNELDWYGKIDEVVVNGNHAILRGHATSGVTESGPVVVGKQFTLEMTDGGSPGAGNDTFKSGWGNSASYNWIIVSGNLVVHYNEPFVLMGNHEEQQGKPEQTPKGPDDKVNICHRTEGVNEYILINVSENAKASHLAHGDYLPGDTYPGMENATFDVDCSILIDEPEAEWHLMETVQVPSNTIAGVYSNNVLETGNNYQLRASGTFTYNPQGHWADAEWYLKDGVIVKGDTEGSQPHVLDVSLTGYDSNVDWGNYNSEHEYTFDITGQGNLLHLFIYDSNHSDNVGSITVEIYEWY